MEGDFTLLDAWRAGDKTAGNQLFERHFRSLLRFFYNKVGESDCEDLLQRTFIACVESRERFRRESSFRGFLFGVARNELLMYFRRQRRERQVDFSADSVAELATSPSEAVARSERHGLLLAAMRTLPVDTQLLLELHYWEGMKAAELAQMFDVDQTTARTRLHRARAALRGSVEKLENNPKLRDRAVEQLETGVQPRGRNPG